jgi:hypothetical protein
MLGELPASATLNAYWKLENTTDSSGNGFTLTNHNTVPFNQGLFTNSADFGSSGTNKSLECANLFTNQRGYEYWFWFTLNSTADFATPKRLFVHSRNAASPNGFNLICEYSISSGVVTLTFGRASPASVTFTADINRHWVRCGVRQDVDVAFLKIDNKITISPGGAGTTAGATNTFTIGNNASRTTQCFAKIDEFIVLPSTVDIAPLNRYYTQAKGRFCI